MFLVGCSVNFFKIVPKILVQIEEKKHYRNKYKFLLVVFKKNFYVDQILLYFLLSFSCGTTCFLLKRHNLSCSINFYSFSYLLSRIVSVFCQSHEEILKGIRQLLEMSNSTIF